MKSTVLTVVGALALTFVGARDAHAQSWKGGYVSATIGGGLQSGDASETFVFDKNLDGTFGETVTTTAGANAFSPGFCAGGAIGPTPSGGCREDIEGVDFGFRLGYDWQFGSLVFGLAAEGSKPNMVDAISAFSTAPAYYTLGREVEALVGIRARVGFGTDRFLIYGTGGGVGGELEHIFTTSNAVNQFTVDEDSMSFGYQAGGGLEFKFSEKWRIGAEYLFTSLDDRDKYTVRAAGPAPATNPFILTNAGGTDFRRSEKFEFSSVR